MVHSFWYNYIAIYLLITIYIFNGIISLKIIFTIIQTRIGIGFIKFWFWFVLFIFYTYYLLGLVNVQETTT